MLNYHYFQLLIMVDEVSRYAENNKCWRKHKNYLPKSTKELLTRCWECRVQIQSVLEPREKPEVQLLLPWSHLLRGNFWGLGVKGWNLLTAKDGVLMKPLCLVPQKAAHCRAELRQQPTSVSAGWPGTLKPRLQAAMDTAQAQMCSAPALLGNHGSSFRWSVVAHR